MNGKLYVLLLVLFASCSTTRKPASLSPSLDGRQYIKQYKMLAIEEMERTGIPASIKLAQGMLESDYGNSTLARKANNHFGIKCHADWKGKKIYHDDDRKNECFRRYKDAYQSYKDHSRFLTTAQRYAFLFDYDRTNYKKWARGLKKAGYATSPTYASKLINLIERYQLYQFDRQSISASSARSSNSERLGNVDNYKISAGKHTIRTRNRIDHIKVKKGDTFESLTKELEMLPWELKKYNELKDTAKLHPGQILYLQPKRNKAERGFDFHIVKEGDTLYSISQLYGIKLDKLYEMNRIEHGDEPEPGQKIWLRKTKPAKED